MSTAEQLAEVIPGARLHLASTRAELDGWNELTPELLSSNPAHR